MMKLDKNAIKKLENKVKEFALTVYDGIRIKHVTADKAGRGKVYITIEGMVENDNAEWVNINFLGVAADDGFLDIYECMYATTITFDVEED